MRRERLKRYSPCPDREKEEAMTTRGDLQEAVREELVTKALQKLRSGIKKRLPPKELFRVYDDLIFFIGHDAARVEVLKIFKGE